MKNRDKYILQRNECDMLVQIQAAIASQPYLCVIEALTGKDYPCPDDKVCMLDTCEECIQNWLNEEAK
jgi:hypothetical protein